MPSQLHHAEQSNGASKIFHPGQLSVVEIIAYLSLSLLACCSIRAVYLLYFHPLASFRGPKKAALSSLWLFSVAKAGKPQQVFEQLHKDYNTRALRIAPNELHITDSEQYHTVYSQRHTFLKPEGFYQGFGIAHSTFTESDVNLHRERRRMLSPFFSKSSTRALEKVLFSKVNKLCERISAARPNGPVHLYQGFRSLTVDVISEFAFGESFNLLTDAEDNTFSAPILDTFNQTIATTWELIQFPILRIIAINAPLALAAKLSTAAAKQRVLFDAVQAAIDKFRSLQKLGKSFDHVVIFDQMEGLKDRDLLAEATEVLIAGSDTTATTLSVAIEEMIKKPAVWEKLKGEVKGAGLVTEQDYETRKIEQLPFLAACVKEAMRYAMAVPGRLPRVVPKPGMGAEPLVVDGKLIPAGSRVSMSAYTVHFDTTIWGSDARTFRPERWLAPNAKHLEKYLVNFSKGARQCLGINLANAETMLTLAMLANQFRFTLDESLVKADLEKMDYFVVGVEGTGLRAHVHEDVDDGKESH
ncbi:hypothetical protein HBH98_125320 [Parastagonospora nodorum]|nr:hypothetical protein HBH53_119360 [Parastagonospora nodorum]KAH3970756.1 hypothetical protein HBH51_115780 [Parastagonospora nodorum]KAH4028475.1 hypothetical protein HBI09_137610 [Parastagonospora nodorum]KAH4171203.1 hypothetical protein HBH43_095390 [Parastagonospora nodorum]KAH4189864.1 hypothetical protein HBH42_136820 [Parastagonospora nodorum]